MRMPEGWERLKGNANEVSSEFFDFSGKDYKIACEIEVALDLMKEMAEALERAEKAVELKFPRAHIQEVLKKFKSWR